MNPLDVPDNLIRLLLSFDRGQEAQGFEMARTLGVTEGSIRPQGKVDLEEVIRRTRRKLSRFDKE